MPGLVEHVQAMREQVVKTVDAARESIELLAIREPNDPAAPGPVIRATLAYVEKYNAIVRGLGPGCENLKIPPSQMKGFYIGLGKCVRHEASRPAVQTRLRTVYKLAGRDGGESRALDLLVAPVLDSSQMSATATICTPAVDRDSEVILPDGIDIESRYRANPIVLWEHGLDPSYPTPIATSEHPVTGELMVTQTKEDMTATSFFSSRNRESEQIYALIEENIVRATSVRVDADPSAMVYRYVDGEKVLFMERSTLIEWSWGCMGVNPETVRKCLDRGKLAGSAISPTLRRMLRKHAAKTRATSPGFDFE